MTTLPSGRLALLLALLGALAAPAAAQPLLHTLDPASPQTNGQFGVAVALLSDVDGDGIDEIVVGTPNQDVGAATSAGRVDVFGGADGALLYAVTSPDAEGGGDFGAAVAALGDVNGDGVADFAVGAPGEEAGAAAAAGRVHVISGATGLALYSVTSGNAQVVGNFGEVLTGVADLTGDGVADFVAGAPEEDGAENRQGAAYLFSGDDGALVHTFASPAPRSNGQFGRLAVAIDDVNGDGTDDVLITEIADATVYSGADYVPLVGLEDPVVGYTPRSAARVPDWDGDGVDDILIGDPFADGAGPENFEHGQAYVVSSADGTVLLTLDPDAPRTYERFGATVGYLAPPSGVGDGAYVIGTLHSELLLGTNSPNRVTLHDPADGSTTRTYESPASGPGTYDQYGAALATRGSRFVVGSSTETVAGVSQAGRAYVYGAVPAAASLQGPEGWALLAAPGEATWQQALAGIRTQGVAGASITDGDASVFVYEEATANVRSLGFVEADLRTGGLGRGLAVYVFEDEDPVATGVQGTFPKALSATAYPASGSDVAFPVSFTDSGTPGDDGWNLVGNPFSANLDWDAPGWTKTHVDQTIYVYDPSDQSYKTWNGTTGSLGDGIVGSFQGFWVKAYDTPTLVAPAGAETTDPPAVAPATAPTLALEVTGTMGGAAVRDGAFVTFLDGAAPGLDALDSYKLAPYRAAFVALFAQADGTALDVSALPPLDGAVTVPLDVAVVGGEAGGLTLSWPDLSGLPADWTLALVDQATGAEVDLRAAPNYAFEAASAAGRRGLDGPPLPEPLAVDAADARRTSPRFALRVEATAVVRGERPETTVGIDAVRPNPTASGAAVVVRHGAAGPARLTLHDVLGREVAVLLDGPVGPGRHEVRFDGSALAGGVYVLRWSSGGTTAARPITLLR